MKKFFKWFGISLLIIMLISGISKLINPQNDKRKAETVPVNTQPYTEPANNDKALLEEAITALKGYNKETPYKDVLFSLSAKQRDHQTFNGSRFINDSCPELLNSFNKLLVSKMKEYYPMIREQAMEELNDEFFKQDIKYSITGLNSSVITLTSFRFSLNKNILDFRKSFDDICRNFRFKTAYYKSNEYDNGYGWDFPVSDTTIIH